MPWLAPLGLVVGLAAGPAAARSVTESSTATLPLRIPATISKPDARTLRRSFEDGVARSGLDPRPAPAEATRCEDAECYRDAASPVGVEFLLGGHVERAGPDYAVEVFAIDGDTGATIARVEGVCEICGVGELGDVVGALAARLRPAIENNTLPTALIVDTQPPGAEVRVDGEPVGTTPLRADISAGTHRLDVVMPGHRGEHVEFSARPGVNESYSFRLSRNQAGLRWLPWTALGIGIATTGAGIGLLSIDQTPIERDCNADVDGNCEFLYDTLVGGTVLTATGVVLLSTGIGLLVTRARRARRAPLSRRTRRRLPGRRLVRWGR